MQRVRCIAVIGGSAATLPQDFVASDACMHATAWGEPSAPVHIGRLHGVPALYLARHGEPHAIAPHRINYRANLRALADLGASDVVALNTVGGIAGAAAPGTLWLPDQLIDYTWGREGSYHDGALLPLDHIEFTEPFDGGMRESLRVAADGAGVVAHARGVYGCTQGPRLETAAEIERLRRDGCDLVGMTAMPEAALARELGLRYAMLAMVVNRAAGCSAEPITMAGIRAQSARCLAQAFAVLERLAALAAAG
ncbi:MAG: S-methyl-5'-thioinosine phosphorylase [Pseudomonadales bacterium]|nr:S-methyl-5'-thioinosine phosphorylase [Pseudomonadales bacterium]